MFDGRAMDEEVVFLKVHHLEGETVFRMSSVRKEVSNRSAMHSATFRQYVFSAVATKILLASAKLAVVQVQTLK